MEFNTYIILITAMSMRVKGNDVVIGILGNSVSIDCKLPVAKSIVWESSSNGTIAINGEPVSRGTPKYAVERYDGVRESLVIHGVTLTDEQDYRCYNMHEKHDIYTTSLNVLVRPQINVTYPRRPVLEGTQIVLACEADGGKPSPEITWYSQGKDGSTTKLKGIETSSIYPNGTGNIASVVKLNVTRDIYMVSFVCDISVPVFYSEKRTVELDVHLIPQPPVIRGYTGFFDEDSEIRLECISTGGHPTPTMLWQINGSRAGDTEYVVMPETNKTSSVTSFLTRKFSRDFDGSVVTCAVTNSVVSARGLKPVSTSINLHMSYEPVVTERKEHYIVQEGENLTLTCMINALPSPRFESVYWTYNGVSVSRGTPELSENASVFHLHLSNVTRNDAGNYTCHASNRLGSSTGQTKLSVLHAPQCSTNITQRVPAKIGNTIRLRCEMFALPTAVLLYWRDRTTRTVVTTMQATIDDSIEGLVYGQIDMEIRSRNQYSIIECIGTNTAIGDTQPCVYKIEPPTPAEAPDRCTVNIVENRVSVTCQPGFGGGSRQTFLLQTQVRDSFLTVSNSTSPQFDYMCNTNETIRVCSVNEDFQDVMKCSSQLGVKVLNTGHEVEAPVVARTADVTLYVVGGISVFAGLLIITTILVLVRRRRQKQSGPGHTSPLAEALSERRRNVSSLAMGEKWWNKIKPTSSLKQDENGNCTPALSRPSGVHVVCSTPYYRDSHPVFSVVGNSPILPADNLEPGSIKRVKFSSIGDSTGFVVSPSVYECNSATDHITDMLDVDYDTSIQIGPNGSMFYKTIDGVSHKHGPGRDDVKSVDMCGVTLDKDYSAGDIADILDRTELDRNDKTFGLNKPNSNIIINGTSLSFDVDFSDSDTCVTFSNISPRDVSSSRGFDSDIKEDDSISLNSTVVSQQSYTLRDDKTLYNLEAVTRTFNQTYTVVPNKNKPQVERSISDETGREVDVTLRPDVVQHGNRLSQYSHSGSYICQCGNDSYRKTGSELCLERGASFHCLDCCSEDLYDIDNCILTVTQDSNIDLLTVGNDTRIVNEMSLNNPVNRSLSTKLRNNSFRTAIDNSAVDKTAVYATNDGMENIDSTDGKDGIFRI